MVAEIGVHDDHEVPPCELQSVYVGGAESELAGARFENDALRGVECLELFGDCEGPVGGGIVDDYEFPVEFTNARPGERGGRW